MNSVITNVIATADAANRFPSSSDLEAVQGSIQRATARLDAAEKLVEKLDRLAQEAYEACIQKYTYLNSPGEANSTDTYKAKCARDIKHYLRLVHYCLVAGGTGPMDEWGVAGQREVYRSLNLPTAPYVEAMRYARAYGGALCNLSAEELIEYNAVLDHTINALS